MTAPASQETENKRFFESLPKLAEFDELTSDNAYVALPDDWVIGIADIVGSTDHIRVGLYKTVNTIGAAVISAQINGADHHEFPFIFGGDGAAFAFWPGHEQKAREGLAAVRRWAKEEFDFELRTALIPMGIIRAAGHDICVARYLASNNADFAMFRGGGLSFADNALKAGDYDVPMAPKGTLPNLEGLSCRWRPIVSQNGVVASIIVMPDPSAPAKSVTNAMHEIVALTDGLTRHGDPLPDEGPDFSWPPEGLDLEAHASRGTTSLFVRRIQLLIETFIALIFFKTRWKIGGFDPVHYTKTTGRNADYRKFEDGLKMTLDLDFRTLEQLTVLLDQYEEKGVISFGLTQQKAAIMTCIVPSVMQDDHIHFIDGADGGYALAASSMKNKMAQIDTNKAT